MVAEKVVTVVLSDQSKKTRENNPLNKAIDDIERHKRTIEIRDREIEDNLSRKATIRLEGFSLKLFLNRCKIIFCLINEKWYTELK